MSDIFHEVEEEVRRERYEKLWKEYGDYVIAGAAFIVIAVAGWQLWRYYNHRQQLQASAEYLAAQQLLDAGQAQPAAEAFGKLAASAPGGYAEVSRLQEAGALQEAGRRDDAVRLYKEIASGNDDILADVARVRAAWAIADTASRSDLQNLLAPLTASTSAWNPMAQEILAYWDFHNGKMKEALTAYKKLASEPKLPAALHQRSLAMATYLGAGGGNDYGSVPSPAKPKTPTAPTPQGHLQK